MENNEVVITAVVHGDDAFAVGDEENCDDFGSMDAVKTLGQLR